MKTIVRWQLLLGTLTLALIAATAEEAYADQTWLECAVTHSVVHSSGMGDTTFSTTMVYVYDSNDVWTYFPFNQRLGVIDGAKVNSGTITWQWPSDARNDVEPSTIDLSSGAYHAAGTHHLSDGTTVKQIEQGQCAPTTARPMAGD